MNLLSYRNSDRSSRQHLGNSAGSVHKKIRCPRCLAPFKTATAVLKHQEAHPSECLPEQAHLDEDDISKESWAQIDRDFSRQSFEKLPVVLREEIDLRVSENLDAYAPTEPINNRKAELRKWYMVWKILFPEIRLPIHPCRYSSLTRWLRLLTTFSL